MTKAEIRTLLKGRRKELTQCEVQQKSKKIQDAFLASDLYKSANQIMVYMPLSNEVATYDIIAKSKNAGKKLVFPSTDAGTFVITPVLWNGESDFSKKAFSVKEPDGAEIADMDKTDIVIVPGIAFDKSGNRIGFGKGCYDRLLEASSATKIGFCYDFQLAGNIPADENDIKMDYIICESGWINCKEEQI